MTAILRSRFAKIILLAILLASMSSAFGGGQFARAQNGGVTFSAAAGFDGYCKDKTWLPVRVEVENTGPDLDASVQVSYKNSAGGVTSTTTEVQLPTSSRKSFFVYIFAEGSLREFAVSVLDGKTVLQKAKLPANCLAANILLVGVISDAPAAFDGLRDITPLGGTTRVAQLHIDDLPERYQAWEALDALVVSNADTGALTAAQKQALELWLSSGGKLFVTGGAQWQRTTAGLNEFLPLEIQSTRNVTDLSSLSAYAEDESLLRVGATITVGTMREGARSLVEQNGVPILSQRTVGFGEVYYLAADPSVNPLRDWAGMKTLYERSLAARPPLPPWASVSYADSYTINQVLGAMKELSMPPILLICGLLVFYMLVMGPLNFLVLRRAKRRELAWMTIPALVILFSCVFYGTGFSFRGVKPILNRLIIMQAWDGAPQADVRALVGIYSPVRAEYDVTADGQFMPKAFSGGFGGVQTDNDWKTLQEDSAMVVPDTRVEIAGMKTLTVEGTLPALPITHTLTIDLSKPAPAVTGTVVNASEFTLRDAVIITPGGWKKLGDFKPGDSVDVNILRLVTGTNSPAFYSADPMDILDLSYNNTSTNVDDARRYAFLQTIITSNTYGYINPGNWGVYLMGWMDRSDLPVSIAGRRYDSVDTVLYIHNLAPDVKTNGKTLYLPSGFFVWESSAPMVTPYSVYDFPDEGFILRFRPAIPISFQSVRSLNVILDSSNPQAFNIYAWDFEAETWAQLRADRTSATIPVKEPDRFVSPNGEVRIRVVRDQSTYADIASTTISLEVTP